MGRSPQRAQKKTLGNGVSVIELPILLETDGVKCETQVTILLILQQSKNG